MLIAIGLLICDVVCAELVTLAQVCLDIFGHSRLAEILNAGEENIHRSTTAAFFHRDPRDISADDRRYGKIANFGLPGGMGANALVRNAKIDYGVDLSVEEAQRLRQAWLETYPEMKEYLALPNLLFGKRLSAHPFPARERPVDSQMATNIFCGIIRGNTHTTIQAR